jgi:hypothetical protein
MSWSFHNADRRTYLKTMLVGSMLCVAFVAVCLLARPQAHNGHVLLKADKLVRTAAKSPAAN